MPQEFRLPDLGEGVSEGQVVRVHVVEGDRVEEDQPLLEVETDKASVEIPSPHSGVIRKLHVAEQQVVNVGDVMVTFGEAADEPAKTTGGAASEKQARSGGPDASASATATATPAARPGPAPRPGRTKPASPAVRKLARRRGIDLESIEGSGPGGRVTRADVERAASAPQAQAAGAPAPARPPAPAPAPSPAEAAPPGELDRDGWGPVVREPVSRARRTIAEAMSRSKQTIPHVTDTDDADVTDLDRLRRGYRSPDRPDRKLTILPFAIRATALALREHPIFNATYDAGNEQIVHRHYVSIAVGVATERGLIAPVLREADRKSIPQIADELAEIAGKARTASFEVNDTRGGTFTISNAGAVGGSRYSTPIINYPQSAVLALGRTRRRPWVVDDRVVPRLILPLSLSFDHRLMDGAHSIRFLRTVIEALENPARLMF